MSMSNRALPMFDTTDGDAVSLCQVLGRASSVHHVAAQWMLHGLHDATVTGVWFVRVSSFEHVQSWLSEEPVPLLSKPGRNRRKVKKLLLPQIIYTPPSESGVGKQGAGSRSPLTTVSQSCRSPLQVGAITSCIIKHNYLVAKRFVFAYHAMSIKCLFSNVSV